MFWYSITGLKNSEDQGKRSVTSMCTVFAGSLQQSNEFYGWTSQAMGLHENIWSYRIQNTEHFLFTTILTLKNMETDFGWGIFVLTNVLTASYFNSFNNVTFVNVISSQLLTVNSYREKKLHYHEPNRVFHIRIESHFKPEFTFWA